MSQVFDQFPSTSSWADMLARKHDLQTSSCVSLTSCFITLSTFQSASCLNLNFPFDFPLSSNIPTRFTITCNFMSTSLCAASIASIKFTAALYRHLQYHATPEATNFKENGSVRAHGLLGYHHCQNNQGTHARSTEHFFYGQIEGSKPSRAR